MDTLIQSFFLIFAGEMGDKTQLLALVLTARFKRPWTVLLGVFIATILNHALAASAGGWIAAHSDPQLLRWILAATFFIFAAWVLVPDKADDFEKRGGHGVLLTTILTFFMAEMGDKTQLATIALGASHPITTLVTIGTTAGMLASNALAIFLGDKLLARVPMRWVRIFSCLLFFASGVGALLWAR